MKASCLAVLALGFAAAVATSGPAAGQVLEIGGESRDIEGTLKDLNAQVTDTEIRIELSADVLFDFDKSDLRKEAEPSLEKVITVLKEYRKAKVAIEGHTDAKGDEAYNQKLSERRADSVRRWLAAHGAKNPMSTRGYGKTRPAAPNTKPDGSDDPAGRQKNRRVEIVVRKG